ncbi:MAG: GNAT family N-acetyltransferase [Dehalococcoidia bacterium]
MSRDGADRLPREIDLGDQRLTLRLMGPGDGEMISAFAAALPEHDLLFLRRDITKPAAVDNWLRGLERGNITTILAETEGKLQGYSSLDRGEVDWSPHVSELRVLVSPDARGNGLGRILIQEAFARALGMGIEKIFAQMTVDQKAAIASFEELGFRAEALLRDHVRDRKGVKHDLLILSNDVARFHEQLTAYGVSEALSG